MTHDHSAHAGSEGRARRRSLLEYVTIPGCRDCVQFEQLIARVRPDYPEIEVRQVAADTPRGMEISVTRGVLRFPVIVLDDDIIAIESIAEADLRLTLDSRPDQA
jgi:glutaredoxin